MVQSQQIAAGPRGAAALVLLAVLAGCASTGGQSSGGAAADEGGAGGAAPSSDETPSAGAGANAGAGARAENGAGGRESLAGAGGADDRDEDGAGAAGAPEIALTAAPYASSVESFTPGDGAGFNASKLPDIVLGPPQGLGTGQGSLDVLSLGSGGQIVLGFGELEIVDGPGPDLLVFENAFWPGGDTSQVFAELGEVSVSEDGQVWHTFPCDTQGDGEGHYPGCAGVTPTLAYDAAEVVPLDPELTGGDGFDLADLELSRARFVKIRDLGTLAPAGTSSGFDLDAVGLVNVGKR